MAESFSLKDELFNRDKVQYLAGMVKQAYPAFEEQLFVEQVVSEFPKLQLKQRIGWIRENLRAFLPEDYRQALKLLLDALPEECDPGKTDDDFGDFIFAPVGEFVAIYGCNEQHLDESLAAIREITKRFSGEDAIRYFINAWPERTLDELEKWSRGDNYHVRRLSSEGARPRLPWCQKVVLEHEAVIRRILNNLYKDPTRYVVRSVANHLNDIAKENPSLVIATLKRWRDEGRQNSAEMDWLTRHALRTLVKDGDRQALELLGYHAEPKITVSNFAITTETVRLGEALMFEFLLEAQQEERLMIDYILHFQGRNGAMRPKVFKIKKCKLTAGDTLQIHKKHPLRSMTTRKLYSGKHIVTLQINGRHYGEREFWLET